MTLIRRAGSLIALTLLLACASDSMLIPRQGLRFSVAQATCGIADGPAVAIFLTRDPSDGSSAVPPYVRINIEVSASELDGSQRTVGGSNPQAYATFTKTEGEYDVATSGVVLASYAASDNEILGLVDITFKSSGHLTSTFRAPLFPNTGLCA